MTSPQEFVNLSHCCLIVINHNKTDNYFKWKIDVWQIDNCVIFGLKPDHHWSTECITVADILQSANIIQFSTIYISHFISRGRTEDNLAILAITKLYYNPSSMQSEEFSGNDKSIEC